MLEAFARWSPVLSLLLGALQILLVWGLWSLRKQFVSHEHCAKQCDKQSSRHAELEQRQTRTEQALANAPSGKELAAIKDQLALLSGEIKGMSATTTAQIKAMERVTHQLDLLLENELNGGKK